jgi:hypothetical protein
MGTRKAGELVGRELVRIKLAHRMLRYIADNADEDHRVTAALLHEIYGAEMDVDVVQALVNLGLVIRHGLGKAAEYQLSVYGAALLREYDAEPPGSDEVPASLRPLLRALSKK